MKILLIEDDFVDAETVKRSLKKAFPGCETRQVCSLGESLKVVRDSDFDVIISDLSLPDSRGIQTVVQLVESCPTSPIVVLTGREDQDFSIEVISQGAQDYLVKGKITPDLLIRSIRYAIQRQTLVTRNEELVATLRQRDLLLQSKNVKLQRVCATAQQFVDNVSHEFRTPLTVIMEYASLLADSVAGPVNEDQMKLLGVIDDRASDLNNMVDDMLDVSKLESGLLGASRSACRVCDVIDHVLPAIRRKAEVRGVNLCLDVNSDLPDVYCDAPKVGRVIVNLAINAIKFSRDPGKVSIFARRHGETDIAIGVSDNGIGIPEDRQREIFQRFSQVKTELRESTKGFGLGLNIAKELVDLNFGRMSVESIEGEGSEFSFTLPINLPAEITRRYCTRLCATEDGPAFVSLVHVQIDESQVDDFENDVERFLVHVLRQNDLIFPMGSGEWLLLVSTASTTLGDFCKRVDRERDTINRNRPRGPLPELKIAVERTISVCGSTKQIVQQVQRRFTHEENLVKQTV